MKNKEKILYIGAHPGGECIFMGGGSALVFKDAGAEVNFLYVYGKSFENKFIKKANKICLEAGKILGIKSEILPFNTSLHNTLYEGKQISLALEKKILEFKPSIVFIQTPQDYLIDHVALAKYSFDTVMGIHREHPGNSVHEVYAMECPIWTYPRVDFYIDISDKMDLVEKALKTYCGIDEKYGNGLIKIKKGLAAVRGEQADRIQYAEGFLEVLKCQGYESMCFKVLSKLIGNRLRINPRAALTYQPAYPI